jgi:hypothetical protein
MFGCYCGEIAIIRFGREKERGWLLKIRTEPVDQDVASAAESPDRDGCKKFGRFFNRRYLCTPFAKTGKTVEFERRVGQSVKTPPFHGGMRGSTPLRGTTIGIC